MDKSFPRTCVASTGEFMYGVHKSHFTALNLRDSNYVVALGQASNQEAIHNTDNFPDNSVCATDSAWVYEIPNPFPFMGATFIVSSNADRMVESVNPFKSGRKPPAEAVSEDQFDHMDELIIKRLPHPLLLTLARTSTNPQVLARLAELSCRFVYDEKTETPSGMAYETTNNGELYPAITDGLLFDVVSNNPFLPDTYKQKMVLIPGVQGNSPVVGEYFQGSTHIWEYLRENSYIPWGHYAANMAHDSVRYEMKSLTQTDVAGLRHLYYQRIFVQLAAEIGIVVPVKRRPLTRSEIEDLRLRLIDEIKKRNEGGGKLPFNATIWGQNFGFDLSPSGYRLNASHQQIHQQFALVPPRVSGFKAGANALSQVVVGTYTQGDLVSEFVGEYKKKTNQDFFETYLKAIRNNRRLDGRANKESALIFYEDDNTMAFVPKAQRSQGEVQIITKGKCGNIIEADTKTRASLDRAILIVMQVLENLGAEMVTAFEISKRFDNLNCDHRLLYYFLPKHPQSPGGFSESQQRWIIGHYPEDFARACSNEAEKVLEKEI